MSVKNLFGKKSLSVSSVKSPEEITEDVESVDFTKEQIKQKNRFVSNVDFKIPENFARYGSAEKYYNDAVSSIISTYPYDGSLKERAAWHNNSSDLVNYVFDNIYPRSNGWVNIGQEYGTILGDSSGYAETSKIEYIKFNGSLNSTNTNKTQKLFEKSNKLNLDKKRGYNLDINGNYGSTVEFYFKKDDLSGSQKQIIFDIWNSSSVGTDEYGRFRVEIHPGIVGEEDKFYIEISSGSAGVASLELGNNVDYVGAWHHYAFAFINISSSLKVQLFVDGDLNSEIITGSAISQVYGAMVGQIGSLVTTTQDSAAQQGWAKLSGSLDEFRYWKTKRTDKDISRNFFTNIGGGTNTDDSNTDLGIYFKFNEGIYDKDNISSYDSNIIDYSGRLSNGKWNGYSLTSRTTGSAIVEGGFSNSEFKDPILYPTHSSILQNKNYYVQLGKEYDQNNSSYIFNTIPEWMGDEDSKNGNGLKDLMQIMAEFFDDLHLKIESVPKLRNIEYIGEGKPLPFSDRLLQNYNFDVSEIFSDSSLLELYYNRNETENYEEKLYNIKNFIYQNIYNNILDIYRSKGTEKSFKNLLRCFGIDEEIVKLNIYANDVEFTFDDRFKTKTIKKKYVDFNSVDRFDSTVHQYAKPGDIDTLGYLTGSDGLKYNGFTVETEAVFPKKFEIDNPLYFQTPFVSCSLFGLHESEDGTWRTPDNASIQVFAIRDYEESKDVRFIISSSCLQTEIMSPLFKDVYEDSRWNFALSLRHEKYPLFGFVDGANEGNYILELYGVNSIQNIKQDSFLLTASIDSGSAESFFEASKMLYIGAHRYNYSGSVVTGPGDNNEQFSDAKISSVRVWNNYLKNHIIDLHSFDAQNFGAESPYGNVESFFNPYMFYYLGVSDDIFVDLPQIETLALHWDFQNVTSSDNGTGISNLDDGEFVVEDISSGSYALGTENAPLRELTKYQFTGKGTQFPRNSKKVVKDEYINSTKRSLPENLNDSDMISILTNDDRFYERNTVPVNHYFAIEKSMYQTISEDILNWFGTVKDFNNLIGRPEYKFAKNYKILESLKELYFNTIQNNPDFERFVDFYKWIDDSISLMIEQLIPGSMNYRSGVANIIESHILERNKYLYKLPTIEFKTEPPLGIINLQYIRYSWKNAFEVNCNWFNEESMQSENPSNSVYKIRESSLNRYLNEVYNLKINVENTFDKKRETEIIRNETGFDIEGNQYYEVIDLVVPKKVCTD